MPLNLPLQASPEEGWIKAAAKSSNALTKQNLENQYYGPLSQAQMMSQMAYAQYLPAQIAGQFLSSPNIRTLDEKQQRALATMFANGVMNPTPINSFVPPTNPGQGLLNQLLNLMTRKENSSSNSLVQTNQPMMQSRMQTPNALMSPPDREFGANNRATDQEVENIANGHREVGYNTPAAQQSRGLINPGSTGGYSMTDVAAAQAAAMNATATGQATNQNQEQMKLNEVVNAQSSGAINALKALQGFHRAYKNSTYKGQYAGSRPSSGPGSIPTLPGGTSGPEQLADTFAQQFLQATTEMQNNGGGITDDARSVLAASKGFNRSLDEDAEKVLYDSTSAKLTRMIKSRNFLDEFYKNNPNATKEQAIAMMNQYNEHDPAYDYENNKALPKNDKKFHDYTSQEALKSYIQNGEYNPHSKEENANENKEVEGDIGYIDETKARNGKLYMATPDGQHWWVPVSQVQNALKDNARQIEIPKGTK